MADQHADAPSQTVLGASTVQTRVPLSRGVNNLGYRTWSEHLIPGWMRWWVITEVGVKRAWQSMWLRRMMMFAWLPAIWFGVGFFVWEQAASNPNWRPQLEPLIRSVPADFEAPLRAFQMKDADEGRHLMWAWLLLSFFRYPQAVVMVMVVGIIAPPLISQDIRSRAFLLYFSRPLTRAEYLFGKLASIWVYLAVISTIPALVLYLIGILLSPNLGVIAATWDMPLRIIAASVVLMLPTSMMALCFSSLSQESRYAGFGWFAIWILGWFTYIAAVSADTARASHDAFVTPNEIRISEAVPVESIWTHLSLYHTLGRAQRWVFGFAKFEDVALSLAILTAITIASLAILYRKISAPMRI